MVTRLVEQMDLDLAGAGVDGPVVPADEQHTAFHREVQALLADNSLGSPDPRVNAVAARVREIMAKPAKDFVEPDVDRRLQRLAPSVEYYLVQTGEIAPSLTVVKVCLA